MAHNFCISVQKINKSNVRVRFNCFDIVFNQIYELFGNILTFNELRDIYKQEQEEYNEEDGDDEYSQH